MTATPQTNCTLEDIAKALKERDSFVICGHASPDADAIGSQLALMHALRGMGKQARCIFAAAPTRKKAVSFLPGFDEIVTAGEAGECDTFIAVDAAVNDARIKSALPLALKADFVACIDHHVCADRRAHLNYVDPDASATALMVWELVKLMDVELTPDIALCCYAGLIGDTGCFRFQSTTAEAFSAAGEMAAAGADIVFAAMQSYEMNSPASFRLKKELVESTELDLDLGIALAFLSQEDFASADAGPEDTDKYVYELKAIDGIRVACLICEQGGSLRVKIRAKDDTDVLVMAAELGGGGHKDAAGAILEGETEECLERVRQAIRKHMPLGYLDRRRHPSA